MMGLEGEDLRAIIGIAMAFVIAAGAVTVLVVGRKRSSGSGGGGKRSGRTGDAHDEKKEGTR